ncbi:hypothetical protein FHS15_005738 [Paenibacillus castaneae]|uniref:hypothetical protein n=1 Tax=Paenibacillus TaxID=44249 RepID=UPI001390D90A|nr:MULTISPECIES: hypothetical protein [Paenibacillus]NIK80548.1 hypothetical protein [Paenibacillus castaneae]
MKKKTKSRILGTKVRVEVKGYEDFISKYPEESEKPALDTLAFREENSRSKEFIFGCY